jgi:hypothetical protein
MQCLLAAERLRGLSERLAVLRIAQSWLTLANRADRGTYSVPDRGPGESSEDAIFIGSEPPIPL